LILLQASRTNLVPKAGHKGDNLSPATSPKSDSGVKGFVLPPRNLQKQEALRDNIEQFSQKQLKQVHQKDISNQKVDDCEVTSLYYLQFFSYLIL
jgi:hypothetical protein